MKLDYEKCDSANFYSVGIDSLSEKYVMVDYSFGSEMYYLIRREDYDDYDSNHEKLNCLHNEIVKHNTKHPYYWFSNNSRYNDSAQNQLMIKYSYTDILLGNQRERIHERIGEPNERDDKGTELYIMSKQIILEVCYNNDICNDVIFHL